MKKISLLSIITLLGLVSMGIWYRAQQAPLAPLESNQIIVGTNSEFPPFSFKENNEFVGFDIDVIKEVAQRLDKEIIIKDMPFDALLPSIQVGTIQVIAAGVTPTPERSKHANFTHPHLTGNPLVIISLKNSSHPEKAIATVEDLRNKKVVVNEGYIADTFMSDQPVDLLRISSSLVSDGMLTLQSGRVDAFVTSLHSIKPYFEKYDKAHFNVTEIPHTEETSAFAVSLYDRDLKIAMQVILDEMEKDGTLKRIKAQWNLL
jgi:arginine/lysine/histidine transporter system substrate-binding protein